MKVLFWCTLILSVVALPASAQTNLLLNPNADEGTRSWTVDGDAKAEVREGPNFALRNGGYLYQIVKLDNAAGRFALLIGRGTTDQISKERLLTGMPSLYGYLFTTLPPGVGPIKTYMTGQSLLGRPASSDQWALMYGIFEVPTDTIAAQVMLMQGLRKGEPHDGTATRFDDVGFYLFDTQQEALAFARKYP